MWWRNQTGSHSVGPGRRGTGAYGTGVCGVGRSRTGRRANVARPAIEVSPGGHGSGWASPVSHMQIWAMKARNMETEPGRNLLCLSRLAGRERDNPSTLLVVCHTRLWKIYLALTKKKIINPYKGMYLRWHRLIRSLGSRDWEMTSEGQGVDGADRRDDSETIH